MRRTTVKIPDELDARLRHTAATRGTTISQIVRAALEEHLRRGGRRLAGGRTFDSGRWDISERIEEILRDEWADQRS